MNRNKKQHGILAGLLALLLLCGCSRVQVPEEELQAAGKPVEGVAETPRPEPDAGSQSAPVPEALLEEGLCALLPGTEGAYDLYDRYGTVQGAIPGNGADLTGVYPVDTILAGYRLSDGSPLLPGVSAEAEWVQDTEGFTVYDPPGQLLYRLDAAGNLLFFCSVPAGTERVSLLPVGRDYLVSLWSGSGTEADPWKLQGPCVLLNDGGKAERDLSGWITAPVLGVLGGETLLLAGAEGVLADAYDLEGNCLAQGLSILPEAGGQPALGGVLCENVWKDGWICSAGLQPQIACPDPQNLQLCGDYVLGSSYDIDGIASNGQWLLCDGEAAVWGVDQGVFALQWQGINYHFDAGTWQHQSLQRCSPELAVSYGWNDDGTAAFRLLFLSSGAVLEYDCPAGAKASALLGQGYALFATAQADGSAASQACRFWVVDAGGVLRYESSRPLMPCGSGPYLLRQEEGGLISLISLEGARLLPAQAP